MIGNTISHYKILEKLGEGGMGIVYKAQDTKLDRLVALKFLPSHLSASEDDKARFIQEAKAASALNHPNVCTIHDIQHHDGQMFIVMEFVDGQTLRYEAKSRTISLKSAIDIGIQIADALAAGFLCNADGVRPLGERSRNIGEQRRRARPQIGRMECGRSRKRRVLLSVTSG
jgi:serine/threonine protein kinase